MADSIPERKPPIQRGTPLTDPENGQKKTGQKQQLFEGSKTLRNELRSRGLKTNGAISEMEDVTEFIPPSAEEQRLRHAKRTKSEKKGFNPWSELDKASKKSLSRRDLITGLFGFLPKKDKDN